MKPLLLSLATFLSLAAPAQDWALFPLGTAHYYADSSASPVTVEQCLMDSVRNEGGQELQFFNMQAWKQALGDCASTFSDPWGSLQNQWPKDSLIIRNDTVFQYSAYGTLPFFFLPQAALGQAWTVVSDYPGNDYDQITIACIGQEERTFLGITDSVKVFSLTPNGSSPGQTPISDFQVVLSKAHGLVEFVPFNLFLFHPSSVQFRALSLIGLDVDDGSIGFTKPRFTDFFHLHPGDLLVWEYEHYPGDISQPWTHFYARDSIVNSVLGVDSVTYEVHRMKYQWSGELDAVLDLSFTGRRAQYQYLVDAGPGAITIGDASEGVDPYFPNANFDQAFFGTSAYELLAGPGTFDTIVQWGYGISGQWLDPTDCIAGEVFDIGFGARLDTRAGANVVDWSDVIGNIRKWTLIGSIINGVPDGDITVGLGHRTVVESAVKVWPNPAVDRIHVELPAGASEWRYELRDALGRCWDRGMLNASGLDVSRLPAGIYVMGLRTAGRSISTRFIKR